MWQAFLALQVENASLLYDTVPGTGTPRVQHDTRKIRTCVDLGFFNIRRTKV